MHIDEQITQTPIGQEFMWDRLSEVDLELLRQNRKSLMHVLANPTQFLKSDRPRAEKLVKDIDDFMARYGDTLVLF